MISPITSNHITAHNSAGRFTESETSKARMQLAFIAALFASSWAIGSLRMGEVISSNSHAVSVLGTLLGM
jgi:hypothetical protein